jgi:hypothetical protein
LAAGSEARAAGERRRRLASWSGGEFGGGLGGQHRRGGEGEGDAFVCALHAAEDRRNARRRLSHVEAA